MNVMMTGVGGQGIILASDMLSEVMMRSGYDVRMSAGTIAAGGTLGILLPPSVMLIVMGPVVGVPVTDLFAERAIALVGRWLPRAVANCDDIEAREWMALANLYAGYVLSNCGASVMHALEHPMSAHHPEIAHGAGLSVMFVSYARHYWDRDPLKFGRIAHLLGRGVAGAPPEHSAQYAADALEALLAQIGLDISISDLGIEREEIPTLVDDALRYMGGAVAKTPADLTREDLISLLEDSFEAK